MVSQHTNLEDLTARVAQLEKQTRRWKLATALLGIFGALFILTAAKAAQRMEPTVLRARAVEAEEFLLKGEDGHVYARLTPDPDLQRLNAGALAPLSPAALEFYDVNGHIAVIVPTTPKMVPAR